MQTLLLAGEQHEADGALGPNATLDQDAGRFQDNTAASAVVGCPLTEIPRIEVRSENDKLVRLFGPGNLADRVINGHGAWYDFVVDLDFHTCLRWGRARRQSIQLSIMLVSDEETGQRLDRKSTRLNSSHVKI